MKQKFIKFDFHCHSSKASRCSRRTATQVVDDKIKEGYGGIALTNHIQPWYFNSLEEYKQEVQKHLDDFHEAYEYGLKKNFTVIFAVEVSINEPFYGDIILFGIDEKLLQKFPILCNLSLNELRDLCKKNNILMVQAHSFRGTQDRFDLDYLDGLEINCNTDVHFKDNILKLCKEKNLILTLGTDYHGDRKTIGGSLLPSKIKNSYDLRDYLLNTKEFDYFIENKIFKYKRK